MSEDVLLRIICLEIACFGNSQKRGIQNIVTDASLLEGFIRNGYLQIEKESPATRCKADCVPG